MTEIIASSHALARKTQRGFKKDDFEQLMSYGTPVGDMEIMLTDKDAQNAIRKKKKEIETLERLKNCVIVVDGNRVVTAYPLSKSKQRARLRYARRSGW